MGSMMLSSAASSPAFSVADIAVAVGISRRSAERRACRQNWPYTEQNVRGGRQRLYPLETLPVDVRRAIVSKVAPVRPQAAPKPTKKAEQKLLALQALSGWKREKTEIKAEIWEALEIHRRRAQCSWQQALADYNSGAIVVSAEARGYRRTLSWPTFERWRSAVNRNGLAGLSPKHGNRLGQGTIETAERIDPESGEPQQLKHWLVGLLLKEPQIKASHVHMRIDAEWPDVQISETRLADWIRAWKADNASDWLRHTNPDAWKSKYSPAFGSHFENITALNQLWELDSSPADWMMTDGRHAVIQAVDMYSRRRRFLVAKSSNGLAIGALFRRCITQWNWGLPEGVRTDQGKDYAGSYCVQVWRELGIEHDLCDAYESQQKGTVERGFNTVFHSILESLPGFVGHNVAERKAIESRKSFEERRTGQKAIEVSMTGAELQEWLDDWCTYIYERTGQDGLAGRSPFDMVTAWRGEIRTIENVRALDLLLLPIGGIRTVTKDGINYDSNLYIDGELGNRVGEKVLCRHDPADVGVLYVYTPQNEFICIAECPDLRGVSRAEIAAAAHAKVAAHKAEKDLELRKFKRDIKRNTADVVIQHRREQAGVVTMLPQRTEVHTTPALEQAAKAAQAKPRAARKGPVLDPRALEIQTQLMAGTYRPHTTTATARAPTPEEDAARWFARLERVEAAIAAGEPVPETDLKWRENFKKSPNYTARQRLSGLRISAQA